MRDLSTAVWVMAFAAYSWVATTACAAWFARRLAQAGGVELGLGGALVWQGAVYAAWLPVGLLVWRSVRRGRARRWSGFRHWRGRRAA